jgi:hypothetical protein
VRTGSLSSVTDGGKLIFANSGRINMEEVVNEIKETKTKLAIAEREGDITRRNTLESYLVELQKKENLLLQQQIQQALPAPAPGNYPIL